MSNGQVREICRESDSQTVYVAYYLGCEMCNKKETYVEKTKGFKIRIDQHSNLPIARQGFQHVSSTSCIQLWY